jgi:hypothetical protein
LASSLEGRQRRVKTFTVKKLAIMPLPQTISSKKKPFLGDIYIFSKQNLVVE